MAETIETIKNHLIIGLGGTGGRVISAYRKLIFERYNGNLHPKGVWIDYLYVDSSKIDLQMTGEQWTMMGKRIRLDEDSTLPIPPADLDAYIANRNNYPYLKEWIGDKDAWANIVNDPKIGEGAAGQKRRLGRLLFANNASTFLSKVDRKIQKLSENPEGNRITVHIVAGTAGGTGSGSVVDACAQLRNAYPDENRVRIILYLLLPEETLNHKDWNTTDNYQPNGYAALSELNALDLGFFKPWNVGERQYEVKRLDLKSPFYSAYLITNENERLTFDVLKVIPASIAEFLFHKTIPCDTDTKDEKRRFFETAELGENPKYSEYDGKHCFKFMTFGVKRLAIPEQEIKEYYGYNFANQAIRSMLYNNCTSESGFVEGPKPTDDYSFVSSKENKEAWHLSMDYICLSKAFLPDHIKENWKTFVEEYKLVDQFKKKSLDDPSLKHGDKLIAIQNMTNQLYTKKFRDSHDESKSGVENFFQFRKMYSINPMVDFIRAEIESDLFGKWKNGDKSLSQIRGIIETLLKEITVDLDYIVQLKVTNDATIKQCDDSMKDLNKRWVESNVFNKLGQKLGSGNVLDTISKDFVDALKKKYILMTYNVSYRFANDLLKELQVPIRAMLSNVDALIGTFKNVGTIIDGEVANRCKDTAEEDQSRNSAVIKQFNASSARQICDRALAIADSNQSRVSEIRNKLVEGLNKESQTFLEAKNKFSKQYILDTISDIGETQAKVFFEQSEVFASKIPNYEKLMGVNILQKLKEDYSGNSEGLIERMRSLVMHAEVLAKHSESEINMGPRIRKYMFVIMPQYKEDPDFQQEVANTIARVSSGDIDTIKIITGGLPNEIVVLRLEGNITPRYLSSVNVLRNAHQRLMTSQQGKVARFETQLEDYDELPSLYKEDDATKQAREKSMREEAIPYLLLAIGMGLVEIQENLETGRKAYAYTPKDEDGLPDFENRVELASTLEKSVEKMNAEFINTLQKEVNRRLYSDYRHIEKQDDLRDSIVSIVKNLIEQHGNNPSDRVAPIFQKANKKVREIIKKLNED